MRSNVSRLPVSVHGLPALLALLGTGLLPTVATRNRVTAPRLVSNQDVEALLSKPTIQPLFNIIRSS